MFQFRFRTVDACTGRLDMHCPKVGKASNIGEQQIMLLGGFSVHCLVIFNDSVLIRYIEGSKEFNDVHHITVKLMIVAWECDGGV